MRTLYLLISLYLGLFLSACSTTDDTHTTPPATTQHAALQSKDPLAVAVYMNKQTIKIPYTVLGKATISEYNLGGIKRQKAYIHDAMRDLAATMGGDAVINLDKKNKTITGTVIAYRTEKKKTSPA